MSGVAASGRNRPSGVGFLLKPFDLDRLLIMVGRSLA
jgi:hypothetical protein